MTRLLAVSVVVAAVAVVVVSVASGSPRGVCAAWAAGWNTNAAASGAPLRFVRVQAVMPDGEAVVECVLRVRDMRSGAVGCYRVTTDTSLRTWGSVPRVACSRPWGAPMPGLAA